MKRLNKSFIGKLFFSLIIFLVIVFIGILVFQKIIFQKYYTSRFISSTIEEIANSFEDPNQDTEESLFEFTQSTQTTSMILPKSSLTNLDSFRLLAIEVIFEGTTYSILVPNSENTISSLNSEIQTVAYLHTISGNYIPFSLTIDGKRILMPHMNRLNKVYEELLPDIDENSRTTISGTISDIKPLGQNSANIITPIISNEILNILSSNYTNLVKFDDGFYYTSNPDENGYSNLVFYSNKDINDEAMVLIAIYPLSHIDNIIQASQFVNIIIFSIVFIVIIGFAFVYSKSFSAPLIKINSITKEMSELKFDSELDFGTRSDEFGELAKNITFLNKNLQNTLTQLNVQNKQLSSSLERENINEKSRMDFIRGMSHEIKTPLAVIQASSEALETGIYVTQEDKDNALKTIQNEVKITSKIINSMMEVYKLDSPNYKDNWTIFNLKPSIVSLINKYKILYENKDIDVESNIEDCDFNGDKEKLEMIISNLISNAIKYTPNNGNIIITLVQSISDITFRITNSPAQIDSMILTDIFKPFYRVDESHSRHEDSNGLGLYIVQEALKQYDSECLVSSNNNIVEFKFQIKK